MHRQGLDGMPAQRATATHNDLELMMQVEVSLQFPARRLLHQKNLGRRLPIERAAFQAAPDHIGDPPLELGLSDRSATMLRASEGLDDSHSETVSRRTFDMDLQI